MDERKIEVWLVKDEDGEYITVKADDWEVSGNGLVFKLGGQRVAHFVRWASYRRMN